MNSTKWIISGVLGTSLAFAPALVASAQQAPQQTPTPGQPGDWGPRRVTEGELRAAFGSGWRIDLLAPDRFEIHPGLGPLTAAAWRAVVVRLAPQ